MENKTVNTVGQDIKVTPIDSSKDGFKNKAGDWLEKAGHKMSDIGAPKIGQKVHDLGDSLEDKHKNPSHPHKV